MNAQNTAENTGLKAPWKPGQSGNPGGRPKGLARKTREMVGEDGEPLIRLWLEIANDTTAKASERLEASKLLADRGWGRAVDVKQQDEEDPLGLNDARERLAGKLAPVVALHEPGAEGEGSG